jgi:hypothetical protein
MVDTIQPRSLSRFRIRKRRHKNRMDLPRAKTQEPLDMTWAGERSEHFFSFQPPGLFFLLTLPFIERANRPYRFEVPILRLVGHWLAKLKAIERSISTLKATNPLLPLLFLEGVPILLCFF